MCCMACCRQRLRKPQVSMSSRRAAVRAYNRVHEPDVAATACKIRPKCCHASCSVMMRVGSRAHLSPRQKDAAKKRGAAVTPKRLVRRWAWGCRCAATTSAAAAGAQQMRRASATAPMSRGAPAPPFRPAEVPASGCAKMMHICYLKSPRVSPRFYSTESGNACVVFTF